MNIRTFMSDKQALIEEGKRIVTSSDDAKYLRKVTIVNLLLNGATASSLSEPCGNRPGLYLPGLNKWMRAASKR